MKLSILLIAATLALAACNQNTAIGNDREAELEPAAPAAPIENAADALRGIAVALIKPETMSPADIAAVGGRNGRCAVKLTEVAFPSFLYEPNGGGVIKLNGKLIELPRQGENRFFEGGLLVVLRPASGAGNGGLPQMEMIVVPPEAKDEIGYRGYVQCYGKNET